MVADELPGLSDGHGRGRVARLYAPAKLTVSLRIEGVRADGYHLLSSEMVSVDLADVLDIDPTGDGLELVGTGGVVGDANAVLSLGPDNLIRRALTAVRRTAAGSAH